MSISGVTLSISGPHEVSSVNVSNLAGLPDGGGLSGEVGAGAGGTVIAAVESPKTFIIREGVTMLE